MPAPCVNGCTSGGRHRDDTADDHQVCADTCPPRCREHCGGCVPRSRADGAAVCRPCVVAWETTLARIPAQVGWALLHADPSLARRLDAPTSGTRTPPAPISVGPVAWADGLHDALAGLATATWWYHPDAPTPPPVRRGTWGQPAGLGVTSVTVPGRQVGREGGRYTGLAGAVGGGWVAQWQPHRDRLAADGTWVDEAAVRTPPAVGALCVFLQRWSTWLLGREDLAPYTVPVTESLRRGEGRWPVRERSRLLPTPCPGCGRMSLERYPPAWPGALVVIACSRVECSEMVREESYGLLTRMVLQDQREAQERAALRPVPVEE